MLGPLVPKSEILGLDMTTVSEKKKTDSIEALWSSRSQSQTRRQTNSERRAGVQVDNRLPVYNLKQRQRNKEITQAASLVATLVRRSAKISKLLLLQSMHRSDV